MAPGLAGGCYALLALIYVGRVDSVPVLKTLGGLARVLLACVGMSATILIFRHLPGRNPAHYSLGLLAAEVVIGAIAYVATAFLVAPAQVAELFNSLSRLRESRHPKDAVTLKTPLQTRDADG